MVDLTGEVSDIENSSMEMDKDDDSYTIDPSGCVLVDTIQSAKLQEGADMKQKSVNLSWTVSKANLKLTTYTSKANIFLLNQRTLSPQEKSYYILTVNSNTDIFQKLGAIRPK